MKGPTPQEEFQESAKAFFESVAEMERFDERIGTREATGAERVIGSIKFADMMAKMIAGFRDLDAMVKVS